MTLVVASLNSGSNGNCYYIGNKQDAVLIDAGISCRETEKRLKRLHLNIESVRAIFITHEHADHITGTEKLSRKFKLPVYINPLTIRSSNFQLDRELTRSFSAHQKVTIGSLQITPVPKLHDAADPYSFTISEVEQQVTVGVFTDIGVPCEHVIHYFKQCHAAFLETNYDDEMLEKGGYPIALKNRIRGDRGHLSNAQALRLFKNFRPAHMSHLFLSHLSQHNNSPKLVQELFEPHAGNTKIIIASRHRETALYTISHQDNVNTPVQSKTSFSYQLDLFR